MKKHLFLKSLLVAIGLLVTSLTTQTWAECAYHVTGGNIYLDAGTPGWNLGYVHMGHGYDGNIQVNHFNESKITGTQLYYLGSITGTWASNVCYLMFWNDDHSWGSTSGYEDVKYWAPKYSGKSTYSFDYGTTYLVVPSSMNDAMATISYSTSGYGWLNHSQTVKKYTWNGTQFAAESVNSGTVTIEPYKMTAHGTASKTNNKGTINTAGSTYVSKDAAYTGEVKLTASANDGYVFLGWYSSENGGSSDKLSSNSTYTYNAPNGTKTVYARFAPKLTEGKTLYLATNSTWRGSSAKFEAVFGNASTQQWVNCSLVSGTTDMYSVNVPSGNWGYVIFCRMNPSGTAHSFDGRWCQTDDMYLDGTKNCVKITGDCSNSQEWCRYSQNPVIIRSHNDWDPENADVMSISGNTCTKSLAFNAHSTYQIKILHGTTEYGLNEMVVTSSISDYTIKSGEYQLRVATAGAGDYTFTYNKSNQQLSISYPTVTHPSVDYCYIIKYSWSTPRLHIWSSSTASSTSSVTTGPILYNYVSIQGTNYYYVAPGDYANFLVSDNGDGSKRTGNLTSSEGYGKYRWNNGSSWLWSNWSFTVTLTEQVTTTSAPSDPTVQFNGTAPSAITAPVCGFYTFGGYYSQAGGGGNQVIGTDGKWIASVSGYTDGSKKWIHEGGTAELFAKWTQSVTLNKHNGESNGSVTLTYNSKTHSAITNPTRTGYTFAGWYTAESDGTLVIATDGTLQSSTTYTDGSGKWTRNNTAPILHAHWTEITHSVSVAAGSNGSISGSVSSVSGVGIATASDEITADPADGYDFASWTLPTGVTAADGYSSASNPIRINATADGVTITANFTAHTYRITLDKGDHGAADGSATVVFNTSALADGTTHVSANAGYQLDGYYDGELKVLNANGSFADANVDGYITSGKWSKSDEDATLTAKFSPVTLYFRANSTSYWNTAANWTPNCVPTIYHDVFIEKPVEVDIAHAVAKSVVIDTMSSNTGKLTVQANKGLEVAGTIKLKNNSGSLVATSAKNIVLESSASGNATLIFDNSTMKDSATVCLYSKGYTDGTQGGGTWVWQYVGVPVTNATRLSDYYGGYMYEWSGGTWVDKNTSEVLTPFNAYSVSYKTASNKLHTYVIDGELAATGDKTIAIPAGTNIMFVANSWTAPIYIKKMVFTNARATVYLLNSGQGTITRTTSSARFAPNTYLPVPVQSSAYTGDSLIAPMQAFIVRNLSASAGTMNIDYGTVVRPARTDQNINAGVMHAPQRLEEEMSEPVVLKMYVDGTEYGDRVILLEREDFTRGFDNGWDGEKLQVNATTIAPRMFAINETGGKEVISAIPELNGTVIGFRPGTDATYTISFEYNGSEPLYLRDTRTNQMASIDNQSEYMFTSDGTNEDSRFIIVKSPAVVTDISETGVDAIARKQMIDGVLYIIRNGKIFSTDGQFVK